MRKYILSLGCCTLMLGTASSIHASGFALIEHSAAGLGQAFAGAAAIAEDGSMVWFNPAAMSLLGNKKSFTAGVHLVYPQADYTDRGSSVNPALTGGNVAAAEQALSGTNGMGSHMAFVPNLYWVQPLNDTMHFGLGVNAPFGLGTSYDPDWYGRYHAIDSDLKTLNINPSIAWKVNDQFSLGLGLNVQYAKARLTSALDSAAVCRNLASTANSGDLLRQCLQLYPQVGQSETDSHAIIEGDSWEYGFNVGALFQPTANTRVGLSYRAGIDHTLEGEADYTIDPALQGLLNATGVTRFNDTPAEAIANLPSSASLSFAHQMNDKLELLADVTWTEWSSFQQLQVTNSVSGAVITHVPENWKDVYRYSMGANYRYDSKLTLRGGIAYDDEPIPDAQHRTPRIPGNDRLWVTFGAGYELQKGLRLDVGYAHLFVDDTPIDNTDEATGYTVRGVYEPSVDIVSAQLNWTFN